MKRTCFRLPGLPGLLPWMGVGLLSLGSPLVAAPDSGEGSANDPKRWVEHFEDGESFRKLWSPYGFLASGIDAKHPLGTSVSGAKSRAEWWQLQEGALCAANFPEEKHPAGITRGAEGTDVRMRCRVKLSAGGMAQITIRGQNPIVERNFHVAVIRLHTDAVAAADNDVIHPKDSPEAAAMKSRGEWNRKFFVAKTEKRAVAPEVWHELQIELRGKELRVWVDGEEALQYVTLCGDVPKTSVGLAGGRSGKEVMHTWFDDVRWESL